MESRNRQLITNLAKSLEEIFDTNNIYVSFKDDYNFYQDMNIENCVIETGPLSNLGIFSFGMKNVTIKASIYIYEDFLSIGRLSYNYHNINGGSNGCDMVLPEFNFEHPYGYITNAMIFDVKKKDFLRGTELVEFTREKIKSNVEKIGA